MSSSNANDQQQCRGCEHLAQPRLADHPEDWTQQKSAADIVEWQFATVQAGEQPAVSLCFVLNTDLIQGVRAKHGIWRQVPHAAQSRGLLEWGQQLADGEAGIAVLGVGRPAGAGRNQR
jgi:hypothetical protein